MPIEDTLEDGIAYHACSKDKAVKILESGFNPGSYFGSYEIAEYYTEDIRDNGEDAIILEVSLADLDLSALRPDQNGIDEPLTYTLRKTEEDIWHEWEASDQSAEASIRIIQSFVYANPISPSLIREAEDTGYRRRF